MTKGQESDFFMAMKSTGAEKSSMLARHSRDDHSFNDRRTGATCSRRVLDVDHQVERVREFHPLEIQRFHTKIEYRSNASHGNRSGELRRSGASAGDGSHVEQRRKLLVAEKRASSELPGICSAVHGRGPPLPVTSDSIQ
jgi:hypothetical protein